MVENSIIRDPIHGIIELDNDLLKIVGTRQFQRLQYIKQLGLVYLAFPGARHTRFEHSLGTMYLTSKILERLKIITINKEENIRSTPVSDDLKKLLELAALLHDIGHPPFSHILEEAIQKSRELENLRLDPDEFFHEAISGKIILGIKPFSDELKKRIDLLYSSRLFGANDIVSIIQDNFNLKNKYLKKFGKIITGEFGTDRIDYIIRDLYFAGIPLAQIDPISLIRSFIIYQKIKGNTIVEEGIAYLKEALPALESLISSRYHLILQLHKNIENRIATKMFKTAVQIKIKELVEELEKKGLSKNEIRESIKEILYSWYKMSDDEFLLMLKDFHRGLMLKQQKDDSKPSEATEIITDLIENRLWQKVFMIESHHLGGLTFFLLRVIKNFHHKFQELEDTIERKINEILKTKNQNEDVQFYVDIEFVKPPKLTEVIFDPETKTLGSLSKYSPLLRGIRDASLGHASILIMAKHNNSPNSKIPIDLSTPEEFQKISIAIEKTIWEQAFSIFNDENNFEDKTETSKKVIETIVEKAPSLFILLVFYNIFLAIVQVCSEEKVQDYGEFLSNRFFYSYPNKLFIFDFWWENPQKILQYLNEITTELSLSRLNHLKDSVLDMSLAELRISGLIRKIKEKPIYEKKEIGSWDERYQITNSGIYLILILMTHSTFLRDFSEKIYNKILRDIQNQNEFLNRKNVFHYRITFTKMFAEYYNRLRNADLNFIINEYKELITVSELIEKNEEKLKLSLRLDCELQKIYKGSSSQH